MAYRNRYRPISIGTIPKVGWSWVELPHTLADRAETLGKPVSEWRYGTYITDRPLTPEELYQFEIDEVAA